MDTTVKEKPIRLGELQDYARELANRGIVNEGTCSTAADTAAKTATLGTTFKFENKATFLITFSNAITVANATLAITHTDPEGTTTTETAKPIYYRGAALEANKIKAGDKVLLRYNGTQFDIVGSLGETYSTMGASGTNHASGLVPDTPSEAGTSKYLREDGTWVTPPNTEYEFNTAYDASTNKAATMSDLTKSNVGLGNVTNDAQVKASEKGAANGVAELDANGKVPSSQLPSYVDDVIDLLSVTTEPSTCAKGDKYYNSTSKKIFTATATDTWGATGENPESGKIYINTTNDKTYRWSGSAMIEIASSDVIGIKVGSSGSTLTPSQGVITIPEYEAGADVTDADNVKSALGTDSTHGGTFLRKDGTWQTPPNDNTTYGLSVGTGDDANKIVLTPSSGNADKITVPYASSAGSVAWGNVSSTPTSLSGYGITDAYTKTETYTKTEVNGLVDTPHQEYVTVDAYANLPATGSKDTIYRVSNYNGSISQVDASIYSEYAWDGSQYVLLCVKSQIGEVFDISVYNNNAKYADLAAALNGGANIPQSLQKGGMSVKFVQSSDNKYVQFRLMTQDWSTIESDWQGVDDVVVQNSKNLIESGAVYPLAEKVQNITFKGQASGNLIEFQTDEGIFIARISPEGIVTGEIKAIINGQRVSLKNMFVDTLNNIRENLAIGDENGFNIVNFSNGHILTKYFNSETVLHHIDAMQEEIAHIQPVESLPTQRRNDFLKDFYSYKYGKTNSSWYERFRIMHYSDTHDNLSNLAEAIGLSQGLIHLIVDTGDNANGVVETPAAATISELQKYATTEAAANTTPSKLLICNGNHDVPNLTKKEYFDIMSAIIAARIPSFSFGDAAHYRNYGYVDITPNNTIGTVRVISLDPFDYDDGFFMNPYGQTGVGGWMNCVFSQTQIDWLITTLRSAANNGYKVITCMHYSWGDNTVFTDSGSANPDANYHQDPFMIPDIINAMQQRTTLNKSYPDDCNINNIIVKEDFSNLTNPLHFVCHLFGHIHSENEYQCQKTDGSQFYDILMIGAPSMGSEGFVINKVKLQPETINSIKCTVLEVDTIEQSIYRVNYGGYKAFDMSVVDRTKKISYRFNV